MYGSRLKLLRKQRNWTIETVSKKTDINRSTYAGYEKEDRKPPIPNLIKIAKLYNVSLDYILGLTDEPHIKTIELNVSEYLNKEGIHWNGIPLEKSELKPIMEVFDLIAKRKKNSNDKVNL